MSRFLQLLRKSRSEDGNAAIEFGLTAPILVVALVFMLDAGFALGDRMELDRNLRAGVQAAMSNLSDVTAIRDVILATANDPNALTVTVNQVCTCGGSATSCTAWCNIEQTDPPSVFINMSATQVFDGIMLPPFTLESETHVQLR